MPKKLFKYLLSAVLILITYHLSLIVSPLLAAPTPTGRPTCDLCGWCNQETNPKPPDWDQCNTCLYDSSGREATGSYYTVIGCFSTRPEKFVKNILSIIFGFSGGIAFLAVLYGSFIVLTSAGDPEKLQNGKDMLTSSIIGILIIIFSVFLLRVVGVDILKIPGFG